MNYDSSNKNHDLTSKTGHSINTNSIYWYIIYIKLVLYNMGYYCKNNSIYRYFGIIQYVNTVI